MTVRTIQPSDLLRRAAALVCGCESPDGTWYPSCCLAIQYAEQDLLCTDIVPSGAYMMATTWLQSLRPDDATDSDYWCGPVNQDFAKLRSMVLLLACELAQDHERPTRKGPRRHEGKPNVAVPQP